jgi:hypothetical protein
MKVAGIAFYLTYVLCSVCCVQCSKKKDIILLLVWRQCETSSHEEHTQHIAAVFEDKMLRKVFGPEREEVAG